MNRTVCSSLLALLLVLGTACDDKVGASNGDVDQAIADHAAQASAHHGKTVDASELTTGTLPVARLPSEVVLESELTSIAPIRSRFDYSTITTDATIDVTAEMFKALGTFTKASAASTVRVTWSSHVRITGVLSGNDFCDFQLRIDDVPTTLGDGRSVLFVGPDAPMTAQADFPGLAAGAHTISAWVRGTAGVTCSENNGGFPRAVFIEEY